MKIMRLFQMRGLSTAVVAMIAIALMVGCYIRQPALLRMLEHKIYDAFLRTEADGAVTPYPIIIDLDEPSLDAYGQWPWPRFLLADLLQKLRESGVASVGVDILLAEADRTSPRRLKEELGRLLGLDVEFTGLPQSLYDYDEVLAKSLSPSVVLGMYCRFGEGEEERAAPVAAFSGVTPAAVPGPEGASVPPATPPPVGSVLQRLPNAAPFSNFAHRARKASLPLPVYWNTASVGMINMNPDEDGVVRRLPLLGLLGDKLYATLSLRCLMAALGIKNIVSRIGPDGLESVKIGPHVIPVSPDGGFIIPFKGPARTFPYYSAKDILEGKIPEDKLRGRIAFLGTSAPGLVDIRISPLERVYPGVEAHASVLNAILAKNFLAAPPWTPGAQTLGIIFCGLMSALAFGFARPRVYLLVGGGLIGLVLYGTWELFRRGTVISPLYVCLTIALVGISLLILRFWQEEKQKNMLRGAFSRYVAPEVVERITRMQGDLFAGEELEVTVMFTDIRGFTTISESLRPEQVVRLLNRYFTPMTALVRGNKGTLDKFIGDALMAFWNAPVAVPDHPLLAVRTALAMQEKLSEINAQLAEEFGCSLRMGVGLHTGKAYVGNMGSEELLNYTLIGDNVNLTSRLEGLCSRFGAGVVVSAETMERCRKEDGSEEVGVRFQALDTLRVKGKERPVSVYAALPAGEWEARSEEMGEYHEAYALYGQGAFEPALAAFTELAVRFPDNPLYGLYRKRCEELLTAPPAEWDGVWTLNSK